MSCGEKTARRMGWKGNVSDSARDHPLSGAAYTQIGAQMLICQIKWVWDFSGLVPERNNPEPGRDARTALKHPGGKVKCCGDCRSSDMSILSLNLIL